MVNRRVVMRVLASVVLIAAFGGPAAAHAVVMRLPSPGGPATRNEAALIRPVAVSRPAAFHWGDAGIGAAITLVLVGAGLAGAGLMRGRRRGHRTALS